MAEDRSPIEWNKKDFAYATGGVNHQSGFTKKEYVSIEIAAALAQRFEPKDCARWACKYADALFEEWEKTK